MPSPDLMRLRDIQDIMLAAGHMCVAARLMANALQDEISTAHCDAMRAVLNEAADRMEAAEGLIEDLVKDLVPKGAGRHD
ncbi:hypothetical protein [Ancylobacter sp. FA202]|uniref:hypothetical protein n=1 Tax=Ancylobacter sp. FA202 TaxID=1111106 RepID=UPI00037BD61B|nr:hypothetical protein [Ancylobacter sp. FA202]